MMWASVAIPTCAAVLASDRCFLSMIRIDFPQVGGCQPLPED